MAAQSGKDMLLKLDQNGSGAFLTVAGLRTRSLSFNAASIDITDAESAGWWRELLQAAVSSVLRSRVRHLQRPGVWDAQIRTLFSAGTIRAWQLILPDFGIIEGPFQIVALEFSADHAGEVTFEIALESAGEMTFAAA